MLPAVSTCILPHSTILYNQWPKVYGHPNITLSVIFNASFQNLIIRLMPKKKGSLNDPEAKDLQNIHTVYYTIYKLGLMFSFFINEQLAPSLFRTCLPDKLLKNVCTCIVTCYLSNMQNVHMMLF